MGAIIGTAIGSAVGASMAPKSGKETREIIKEKSQEFGNEAKEVTKMTKETTVGFWRLAKAILRRIFGSKSQAATPKAQVPKAVNAEDMRKIPHETDIIPEDHVDRN